MLKPFRLLEPTTLPDAAAELARLGDEAKVYAGGAELLLLMRHGVVETGYLLNVKRIPDLHNLTWDGEQVRIGAAVTHHRLERDPLVQQRLPMFAYAESQVGNIRVRHQGTLGGNLVFADPHADPAAALLLHDASVTVAGGDGQRQMSLDEFLVGTYEVALQPDELLTEIQARPLPEGWGHAYLRIERFHRPTLNVAAATRMRGNALEGARLAVGCVGPRAIRLTQLEAELQGLDLESAERLIRDSKPYLTEQLEPVDDVLGSAQYKIHIASVLLARAVSQASRGRGAN